MGTSVQLIQEYYGKQATAACLPLGLATNSQDGLIERVFCLLVGGSNSGIIGENRIFQGGDVHFVVLCPSN